MYNISEYWQETEKKTNEQNELNQNVRKQNTADTPLTEVWLHCICLFNAITNIHPSIFYTCLIKLSGRGGAGAYPTGHRVRGAVHPGQVASPSHRGPHRDKRDTQPHTGSHSLLRTILESPINLTCMFLDSGRKPEYPERTHAYTGRTCEHTERPQEGLEPGTFLLWGDSANHHAAQAVTRGSQMRAKPNSTTDLNTHHSEEDKLQKLWWDMKRTMHYHSVIPRVISRFYYSCYHYETYNAFSFCSNVNVQHANFVRTWIGTESTLKNVSHSGLANIELNSVGSGYIQKKQLSYCLDRFIMIDLILTVILLCLWNTLYACLFWFKSHHYADEDEGKIDKRSCILL